MSSRKQEARKLFSRSRSADKWNDLYGTGASIDHDHFIRRRDAAARCIIENAGTDADVLDLGCGAGVLTEVLLDAGYSVSAADISLDMLGHARERLERHDPRRYRLLQAECEHLPYPDDSFDVVACIGVFGYFENVDQALLEIRRVLRPGGLLVMSIRNELNRQVFDGVKLAKNAVRRVLPRKRTDRSGSRADGKSPAERFTIEIFDRPRDVIAGVARCGYRLEDFVGIGYGPFKMSNRSLTPHRISIVISRALQRIFGLTGLQRFTRWVADVSIYLFRAA